MSPENATTAICDCHVHVIGPKSRYPLAARRTYTPADAPVGALVAMMKRLCLGRVVIVQPSVYGTDNACMLDALAALGGKARGVAVLPAKVSGATLDDLHRRGIRGLRVNIASTGAATADKIEARLAAAAALCVRNGWHVQVFLPAQAIAPLAPTFRNLPVPVVVDHFGLVSPADLKGNAVETLRALLAEERAWVKLSAPYRLAADPADPRIGNLARLFADANPEQVVWASDWPHTPAHGTAATHDDAELPYRDVDTRALLAAVDTWLPDNPRQRRRLLVDNPARLYGFEGAAA